MNHLKHYSRKKKRSPEGHLQYTDRQLIERKYVLNQNRPKKRRIMQTKMAKELLISPSTLSRELKRGKVQVQRSNLIYYYSYSADVAQADYDKKASKKGRKLKLENNLKLVKRIEDMLLGKADKNGRSYSPYAATKMLKKEGWGLEKLVCWRTIYNYVDKGVFLNVTQQDLPRDAHTVGLDVLIKFRTVNRLKNVQKPQRNVLKQAIGRWIVSSQANQILLVF